MNVELTQEQAQFIIHAMTTMKNLANEQWQIIQLAASVVCAIEAAAMAKQKEE